MYIDSAKYLEVAERLSIYREQNRKTQEEMSILLGVTQGHYSKFEKGISVISYKNMKLFWQAGGDIYYLITGRKYQTGIAEYYFDKCVSFRQKTEMYKLILWALRQVHNVDDSEEDLSEELQILEKYAPMVSDRDYRSNIWAGTRKIVQKAKQEFAADLQINVKRYRSLESHKTMPNADMLVVMYQRFRYSPLLFFDGDFHIVDTINRFAGRLSVEAQTSLVHLLDTGILWIKEQDTKDKDR